MSKFKVIVGNIGMATDTDDRAEAERDFHGYVADSKANYGRASGEDVTLMVDGEPELEYTGWLSMQMEDDDEE